MQEFYIVLNQLTQLFIIFGIGAIAMRNNILTVEALPHISKLITRVLLPIFISINILKEGSLTKLLEYRPMFILAVGSYLSLAVIFYFVSKMLHKDWEHSRIFQGVFVFSNIGFIGFPIFFSLYPQDGPLYIAWISVADQALLWTYGVYLTSGAAKFNFKQMINPSTCALLFSLILLALDFKLSPLLYKTFWSLGCTATPLCMIYMGAMFYHAKPFWVLRSFDIYVGIFLKMIILPLVAAFLVHPLAVPETMKGMLMILVALPPMIVIPMIVPEKSKEKAYAVGGTLVGILACLITVPLVVYLNNIIWMGH